MQDGVRKAKAEELRLSMAIKSNENAFFRYVHKKREGKKVAQPLNEDGEMVADDKEKSEVLNS